MHLSRKTIVALIFIALSLSACGNAASTSSSTPVTQLNALPSQTEALLATQNEQPELEVTSTATPISNPYADCGPAGLVDVGYYFKDNNGEISPTQLVQVLKTSDEVRDYVKVITCLKQDEGWVSNPDEVVNGYENQIIFFDKFGKAHTYRIIIGGHYIEPYDPVHKDITASINGTDVLFYNVQEWIDATRDHFVSNGTRQMGVDVYLDDTQGDLSKVLTEVYNFRETNMQIFKALQTGEGYPDQVPDGFFLFATYSWLIQPD